MERRKFLQMATTYTSGLLLLPDFLASARNFSPENAGNDNIVVFVQLTGGNDGLNTFIPYENSLYYDYRPNIGIAADQLINKTNGLGWNPVLEGLAQIAQNGHFSLIQNVGYPNPNRSHFRSMEIWQTASDAKTHLSRGWLGRFLDTEHHDNPLSAINIASTDNLALASDSVNSITIKDPKTLEKNQILATNLVLSDNPQLDFSRKIVHSSTHGMAEIQQALDKSKNSSFRYENNIISKNLMWISRMIKGGLGAKIYYTSLGGFDTHENQKDVHQRVLKAVNNAIFSFYTDLKNDNLLDRVTIVVFSEFGRRVKDNGSGTDHGTAAPLMVIGGKNQGKIIGKNPDLANLDSGGDLIYDIDFRSIYASILEEKFGFNAAKIGIKQQKLQGIF